MGETFDDGRLALSLTDFWFLDFTRIHSGKNEPQFGSANHGDWSDRSQQLA
jgi:hypothetical protein